MLRWFRDRRRSKLRSRPFPPEWREVIRAEVPYYGMLPDADQRELEGHIQVFIAEKHFEGCGGLEMTDAIRVSIAAQACILLLHRETDYYPELSSILVYPSAYVAPRAAHGDSWLADESQVRLGESWATGQVVLSWDNVRAGAADVRDGHNVVLHEFAHQLDQEFGESEGAPVLPQRSMYVAWARILGESYEKHGKRVGKGRKTVIDRYGAESPAEFFAVVTETFFEKPRQLRRRYPELYDQMKAYYRQDPIALVE